MSLAPKLPMIPSAKTELTWSDGVVRLRNESILGRGEDRPFFRFLGRVGSLRRVRSVSVERKSGTAVLRHDVPLSSLPHFLQDLADALLGRSADHAQVALPREAHDDSFTLYRHGAAFSSWEAVYDHPGHLRIRHPIVRRDRLEAKRVTDLLASVPGVKRARSSGWTDSLLIDYDPASLDAVRLIRLIEEARCEPELPCGRVPQREPVCFRVANTNLGIAAAGEFLLPLLSPVSGALLVGSNLKTLRSAYDQLRDHQVGLPVLYATIIAATLATGSYLNAALMYWFLKLWHDRHESDLTTEQQKLLDALLPEPAQARLLTLGGAEVVVAPERIEVGDRIIVRAGDVVPADAEVETGLGMVDERFLLGLEGASKKQPGSLIYAGSTVFSGELRIEVTHTGEATRAASLARDLVAGTTLAHLPPSAVRPESDLARRAVAPTLGIAGVAAIAGGLGTALAVLRPDYVSGPGLSRALETLRSVSNCARQGIIVRGPEAFERLHEVNTIILDDGPALRRANIEVDRIETRMPEADLLHYAASAYRALADDRARALAMACRARGGHISILETIELRVCEKMGTGSEPSAGSQAKSAPREVPVPIFSQALSPTVVVKHGKHRIRASEAGLAHWPPGSLLIEIDEAPVGLISFRQSARLEAAEILGSLRQRKPLPITLVSGRPRSEMAALAASLGVNQIRGGLTPDAKAAFVRACRAEGLGPAYVGDCNRNAAAANEASLAIHLDSGRDRDARGPISAAIVVLGDRLGPIDALWSIADSHRERVRLDQSWVVLPNAFCVAGAFLFGFTGFESVVISNLGTYGSYSRAKADSRSPSTARRYDLSLSTPAPHHQEEAARG